MANEKMEGQEEKFPELSEAKKLALKMAHIFTDSVSSAAVSIDAIHNQQIDMKALIGNLQKQVDEVLSGDVSRLEGILMTQAQTLNVLFHSMITKMMVSASYPTIEVYSNLAIRAQNQCRQTLAVLGDLKRPQQTTVVQQQNLAINQHVNNSAKSEDLKGIAKPANELLEITHEPVDSGATITPSKANFQLEAVGEVYRSENEGG